MRNGGPRMSRFGDACHALEVSGADGAHRHRTLNVEPRIGSWVIGFEFLVVPGIDAHRAHFAEIAMREMVGKKNVGPTSGPMGAIWR